MSTEVSAMDRLPGKAVALVTTRAVSALGTTVTVFAMDVWIFKQTGSYAVFAYLALLATLPNLVLAPFAGITVDRYNKKWLLMGCEIASLAAVLFALERYQQGKLGISAVAIVTVVLSIVGSLRWMTMSVAISMLVPKQALARMNGVQQSFYGLNTIAAPMMGAVALEMIGFAPLLIIDGLTCLIAVAGLIFISSSSLRAEATPDASASSFWQRVSFGIRWIVAHRALFQLMLFFMFFNLGVSVFSVSFAPRLLSVHSSDLLGGAMGLQGAGAILTGLVLARRRTRRFGPASNVLIGSLAFGLMMLLWGLTQNIAGVLALAFSAGALTSLIMSSSQTLWQSHVPVDIQGRVFAARMMVSFSLGPLAILASIPMARSLFDPLLWSLPSLATLWGVGQGASIGLMVSALGVAVMMGCVWLLARGGLSIGDLHEHRDKPPSES